MSSAESAGPALADTVGRARPWVRTESPEGFRFQFQAIRNSSEAGGPLPPEIVVKSPRPRGEGRGEGRCLHVQTDHQGMLRGPTECQQWGLGSRPAGEM